MLVNSFFLLVFLIFLFFLVYHFYLLSKPQANTSSFLLLFLNNNPKTALILPPLIYVLLIFGAIFLGYYSLILVPLLLLLNLWLKSSYLVYFIHVMVLSRLLWYFSPLWDIYLMVSFHRSFICVFSLFAYLFFIYHHKILLLWLSGLLRLLVVVGTGEVSFVFAGGGITLHTSTNLVTLEREYSTYTPLPVANTPKFFDTLSQHKSVVVTTSIDYIGLPKQRFEETLLRDMYRIYYNPIPSTAEEQALFLKHGRSQSLTLSNYNKLGQSLGSPIVEYWKDGYRKEMERYSNLKQLSEPDKTLVEQDFVDAQRNFEEIAVKGFCLSEYPNEQVHIARGYSIVDFELTRPNGQVIRVDVTAPSARALSNFKNSYISLKLNKLPLFEDQKNDKLSKILLYDYAENTPNFLNAPSFDKRLAIVTNESIQQLLYKHNIKVDFLKPMKHTNYHFIFSEKGYPLNERFTSPKSDAFARIQFVKK